MSVVPFVSTATITGMVVFDPTAFIAAYPEFTGIPTPALQTNFTLATLQLNNGVNSRVQDATVREPLLSLLVAHITFLAQGTNNGTTSAAAPGVVGRVNTATEGSVSVGAEYASNTGPSLAYYAQTKYGAQYWQATASYRTMRYTPPYVPSDVRANPFVDPTATFGPYGG